MKSLDIMKKTPVYDRARASSLVLAPAALSECEKPVDLDPVPVQWHLVYSPGVQHDDLTSEPTSASQGRARGDFSYFQDPVTRQEYFAVLIADATACCAQGIEFVWEGHRYPDDYPPVDTELTVTGVFNTCEENGFTYLQLSDAEVSWKA